MAGEPFWVGRGYDHVGVVEAVHGDGSVEVTWDSYGDGINVRQRVSGRHLPTSYLHIDNEAIKRSGGGGGGGGGTNHYVPRGHYDELLSPRPGFIRVRGWAKDQDVPNQSLAIHLYVGGRAGTPGVAGYPITANVSRPDVGGNFGFDSELRVPTADSVHAENKLVCVYAINNGSGHNPELGCKNVVVKNPNPIGGFDEARGGDGKVLVSGWTVDQDAPNDSLRVHVCIGGRAGEPNAKSYEIQANKPRADVAGTFPGNHGYQDWVTTDKRGNQLVCVYGINKGTGESREIAPCKTVHIGDAPAGQQPPSPDPTPNDPPTDPGDGQGEASGSTGGDLGIIFALLALLAAAIPFVAQWLLMRQ